jgi:hypothetical protein
MTTLKPTPNCSVDSIDVHEDHVVFDVILQTYQREAPRVGLRAGKGGAGPIDVVGVTERAVVTGGDRILVFHCEAPRAAASYGVTIEIDRPGAPREHLAGPTVPARGEL